MPNYNRKHASLSIYIAQAIHYGIVCDLKRLVNIYMPIHRRDVEWTMINDVSTC